MSKVVPVTIINDNAVDRKIRSTASSLQNKYSKRRKINEARLMKDRSKFSRFMSGFSTFLLVVLIIFSLAVSLSTLVSKMKRTPASFAGYSCMEIVSGSMTADSITINGNTYSSGHQIGEKIVLRSVDTDTLNVGDKIAFYVYTPSLPDFYNNERHLVDEVSETEYETSFGEFLGFPSKSLEQAAKSNSRLVFHHIIEIYENAEGTRYFRTQGSAVGSSDYWVIKDCYVVGVYDNSTPGKIVGGMLAFLTSRAGVVVTIITPLALVALLIFLDSVKNVGLARLELDCIEEKRKITDPICVKNNIGFRLSKKNKYKVLAQAQPDEKLTYISLLWRDGSAPDAVKKYVMRKDLLLRPNRKLLELNRQCEKMFEQGQKPEEVAEYYLTEKGKIEQEQQALKNRLKLISKHYKQKEQELKLAEKQKETSVNKSDKTLDDNSTNDLLIEPKTLVDEPHEILKEESTEDLINETALVDEPKEDLDDNQKEPSSPKTTRKSNKGSKTSSANKTKTSSTSKQKEDSTKTTSQTTGKKKTSGTKKTESKSTNSQTKKPAQESTATSTKSTTKKSTSSSTKKSSSSTKKTSTSTKKTSTSTKKTSTSAKKTNKNNK